MRSAAQYANRSAVASRRYSDANQSEVSTPSMLLSRPR